MNPAKSIDQSNTRGPRPHNRLTIFVGLAFFVAGLGSPLLSAKESAATWIWYPERAPSDCIDAWRFFRKRFSLGEAPVAATLRIIADDSYAASINGVPLATPAKGGGFDVGGLLRSGENLIAIKGHNVSGPAGLIAALEIRAQSGDGARVVTDASWSTTREEVEGWDRPDFGAPGWLPAQEIGDAFAPPWHRLGYGASACATIEERRSHEDRLRQERAEVQASIARLAGEAPSCAKVVFRRGWPLLEVDGSEHPPLLYSPRDIDPETTEGATLIRQFRDAGYHLYHLGVNLAPAWRGPDHFDFSDWDRLLAKVLALDPKARIILGIRLDAPDWWLSSHETEWVGYATGAPRSGDDQIARVKAGSMASEVWMGETEEAFRAGLRHLELSRCGRRVIGYQPNYGVYCEWHYYGMANDMPDTGAAMAKKFRAWLRATYRDEASLRASWKNASADFENAAVPARESRLKTARLAFRDPATEDRQTLDYYACHQRVVADCLLRFCRAVKEETRGRALAGAWYGYHFGMNFPPEGWHLLLGEVLRSPLIDFLSSPYCYDSNARAIGGDGRMRTLGESLRLHGKLHLYEADTRTHLADDDLIQARTCEETIACLRREVGHALIRGGGLWWVDFGAARGRGWFNEPKVMDELARLRSISESMRSWDGGSASEVALVCDPESVAYLGYPPGLGYRLITGVCTELFRCGAPFDTILLDDLGDPGLRDYRVYIFLDCFYLDASERERIARVVKCGGKTAIWLFGSGFIGPEGASARNCSELTGIKTRFISEKSAQIAEVRDPNNPLMAGLRSVTRTVIDVRSSETLPGALDPALWKNLRSAETMRKEYENHSLGRQDDGIVWRFRLREKRWTDMQFQTPMPRCDALGLRVRALGKPISFRVDLMDAKDIPWSGPPVFLEGGEWRGMSFPIRDFQLASYARQRSEAPQFPIRAIKFVAEVQPCEDYGLAIGDASAQVGSAHSRRVAVIGDDSIREGPVFAVIDPEATILADLTHGGRRYGVLAERHFRDWNSVVLSLPFIPREFLSGLLQRAGVHQFLEGASDVLLGNRSLLLIHSREGGKKRVSAHGETALFDLMTEQTLPVANGSITVEMMPASTRLFRRVR